METNDFLKELVLKQLESHLKDMFKTQVGEIWKSVIQPEKITVEKMREEIYTEVAQWDLERITKFVMDNPVRKPRGLNGGRKKTMTDEDPNDSLIGNLAKDANGQDYYSQKLMVCQESKPKRNNTIDLDSLK